MSVDKIRRGARGGRMMERGWWFGGGCSKRLSHNQTLFLESRITGCAPGTD
jgi:hypothetical protein